MLSVVGVTLLLLFVPACEYPGIERAVTAELSAGHMALPAQSGAGKGASVPAKPSGGRPPSTEQSGSLEKPMPAGDIFITEKDFFLEPETIVVQPGKITFVLTNAGKFTHDFRVSGEGVNERSKKIGIGRTQRFTLDLGEGEYEISCPLSNHADRGMTGKLIVKHPG